MIITPNTTELHNVYFTTFFIRLLPSPYFICAKFCSKSDDICSNKKPQKTPPISFLRIDIYWSFQPKITDSVRIHKSYTYNIAEDKVFAQLLSMPGYQYRSSNMPGNLETCTLQ